MKLLIIRHADPDYSIDSLTSAGWEEARLLADRLTRLDVKAFYCSPLGRARDTAKETLERLGAQAEICIWLREFGPKIKIPSRERITGCWGWLPQDWTQEKEFYDRYEWMQSDWFRTTGVKAHYLWVIREFDALLARHGYVREGDYYRAEQPNEDTIVLFCHFGVECVLLSHLMGISPMPVWHGMCAAPSSVTVVTTEERRKGIACFRVNAFGDTSHLYAGGREPSFAARFCETYENWEQKHD